MNARKVKAAAAAVLAIGMLTLIDDCGGDAIVGAAPQPAASWHAPAAGR